MATTAATTTTALRMKLLVDTKAQRVLFAEAGNDVVDFLFSLLSLPIATAVKLLGKESMVGSVGDLYASVEALDDTYVLPGAAKGALLRPHAVASSPAATSSISSLLLPPPAPKAFFRCPSMWCDYVTDARGTSCPHCKNPMTRGPVSYAKPGGPPGGRSAEQKPKVAQEVPAGAAEGFVKGVVTYTVTDNLTVTPMSAISSISLLLDTFAGVRHDLGGLEEKIVQIGYDEVGWPVT
jgi:hypothetical protein